MSSARTSSSRSASHRQVRRVGEVALDVEQRGLAAAIADVGVELVESDDEVGVRGEEVLDVELGRHLHREHRRSGSDGERGGHDDRGAGGRWR